MFPFSRTLLIGWLLAGPALAGPTGQIAFPEGYPDKSGAVVSVRSLDPSHKENVRPLRARIEQLGMQYRPYITVLTPDSVIDFRNDDRDLHSLKASSGPLAGLQTVMIPKRISFKKTVKTLGASELLCDMHAQMKAYVVVVPTNNFAITNAAGKFTLPEKLPPFPVEMHVWHEILPEKTLSIRSDAELDLLGKIKLETWLPL